METLPTSHDFLKMLNTTDPKCWVEYLSFAKVLLKLNFYRYFYLAPQGFFIIFFVCFYFYFLKKP